MTGPSAAAAVSSRSATADGDPGSAGGTGAAGALLQAGVVALTSMGLDPSDGTPAAEVARAYVAHLDARASDGRKR